MRGGRPDLTRLPIGCKVWASDWPALGLSFLIYKMRMMMMMMVFNI